MAEANDTDIFTLYAALEDARAVAEMGSDPAMAALPASRLVAYAARPRGAPRDLGIERLLRGHAMARRIYDRALHAQAAAYSPLAAAASGENVAVRVIGRHRLELIEDDGMAFLVIRLGRDEAVPTALEVRSGDGAGHRLDLARPVRGIVQMPLDRSNPLLGAVHDLLKRPDSAVYLLR